MGRPPSPEPVARKSVTLPISLWDAINEARKGFPSQVPTEAEAIRILLREALAARAKRDARRTGK